MHLWCVDFRMRNEDKHFLPVHLASNTGGTWPTTFSITKSRKPINNLSTGPSLLFFGRKIKIALVGIPALHGIPIFLSRGYAPVFDVEPQRQPHGSWAANIKRTPRKEYDLQSIENP